MKGLRGGCPEASGVGGVWDLGEWWRGATVFGPLVVVRQTQPVLNKISKAFYK